MTVKTYASICAGLKLANLRGAYLIEADLRGAYLNGVDLSGVSLRSADLRGADLSEAYLYGADLRGAYLNGAYLNGVSLRSADLRGADLSGAIGYVDLGTDVRGYHFRAVQVGSHGWNITAGCRSFTLLEAVKHWRKAKNKDALARVAILKAHPLPEVV